MRLKISIRLPQNAFRARPPGSFYGAILKSRFVGRNFTPKTSKMTKFRSRTKIVERTVQKIRHLQKNTNCHGELVTPITFLNFLYHHSAGRFSLDCIGRIVDRTNSICLSQFLKNTRRLSGRTEDLGSDLLKALHLKVSKLYADARMVQKIRSVRGSV